MMAAVKQMLTDFLYKLGVGKREDPLRYTSGTADDIPQGTQGKIDAPAALLREENRIVLTVDYEFADIPSWVEWDAETKKLSVAQMGGAVADLDLELPAAETEQIKGVKRLVLITRRGQAQLAHFISFIVRE